MNNNHTNCNWNENLPSKPGYYLRGVPAPFEQPTVIVKVFKSGGSLGFMPDFKHFTGLNIWHPITMGKGFLYYGPISFGMPK